MWTKKMRELTNVAVANIAVTHELIRHVTVVIACGSESAPTFAGVGLAGFGRANPGLLLLENFLKVSG